MRRFDDDRDDDGDRVNKQGDYYAVELINGHVYLHLDLGSGGAKVKATSRRIDDGAWHEIAISRNGKGGRITVDGASTDFVTPGNLFTSTNTSRSLKT